MAKKQTIWIERLGIVRLMLSLLSVMMKRNTIIYYDMLLVTRIAKKTLSILKRYNQDKYFSCKPFLRDMKDGSGGSLYYQLDANMRRFLEKFCKTYLSDKTSGYQNMIKCYLTANLQRRARFATIVDHNTRDQINDQTNIIIFEKDPHNIAMKDFWKEKGFLVKESFNLKHLRLFLVPIYYSLRVFLTRISKKEVKTNIKAIRPSVWVEYAAGDNVDFFFWMKYLDRGKYDCICYLDRPDSPPNSKVLKEIEEKYDNIGWIDGGHAANLNSVEFGWGSISNIFIRCIEFHHKGSPLFLRLLHFQYEYWLHIYKMLFSRYKVKIFIQHQDVSWKQEVQRNAIEAVGGIFVGFHWSSYHVVLTPIHLFPFHVFFVWGKLFHDVINSSYNTCNYVLPSGVWITPKNNGFLNDSRLRGLDFVFTIFDSSVAHHLHQTPASLSRFYLRILEILDANPHWGAVAKCKGQNIEELSYLPEGRQIVNRMKTLIKEKRLVALDYSVLPMVASRNSDLCVCYGINSAGIISALYGGRSVHWDCSWVSKHPFYKDRSQKIVYRTLDEIEDAVILAEKGDKSIGDFSSWKKRLNFNDDFAAGRRVGEFFNDYLDRCECSSDVHESLKFSVSRYIEKNHINEEFFQMTDNLWEE